eukprot:g430.t1
MTVTDLVNLGYGGGFGVALLLRPQVFFQGTTLPCKYWTAKFVQNSWGGWMTQALGVQLIALAVGSWMQHNDGRGSRQSHVRLQNLLSHGLMLYMFYLSLENPDGVKQMWQVQSVLGLAAFALNLCDYMGWVDVDGAVGRKSR